LFGLQFTVPETGVIMNNEMNDFSMPGTNKAFGFIPSPSNYIWPGKRPQSSIPPAIVERADVKLYFVIGAAGGSRITFSTIQNIYNVLDLEAGDDGPVALAQPRLHGQLVPNVVTFEYAYNN
jgi:gamma-glutamyltranspeptidase/glutathione hydrolase